MADKKISQLTPATTPLAGTEELPIVQGGNTVKVSVNNLTAGRNVDAVSIANGLGAVGTPSYTFTGDTNTGMWSPAADTLAFSEGGVEVMRIDSSGNVGIGTSSPTQPLSIRSSGAAYIDMAGGSRTLGTNSFTFGQAGDGVVAFFNRENAAMYWATNSTERMRIDTSGNLGLGVTPSAWVSPVIPAIDIGTMGGIAGQTNAPNLHLTANSYLGSGLAWKYKTSNYASRFVVGNDAGTGGFAWYTAPSGTAGNAISFTQAMTLDASGSLLIGKTSSFGSQWTIQSNNAAAADNRIQLTHSGTGGTSSDGLLVGIIGTDAYVQNFESGPLILGTSGSERARIDSSGNLLVGTTSQLASCKQSIVGGSNGVAVSVANGAVGSYMTNTSGTGDWQPFSFNVDGTSFTQVGSITITGGTTTNYNTSSDARLKENIAPADDAAALIDAIQVRKFDWKADGSHQRYGMVAQELLEVAPEAVSVPADEEQMMGVDYSKLVPMLVKEIQSLRARVAQLEGN